MILSLDSINSYYGKSHILYDVSLDIEKGEAVALLGRNGAGKTTTLNSIVGLVVPRQGSILYEGANLVGLKPDKIVNKGIALVPDSRRIFPNITVHENLIISERKTSDGIWDAEKVYELFPELVKLRNNKGRNLSGGEQQMLAIARALVGNHKILLLDEPFEGLAPIIVKKIVKCLEEIKKSGMTMLIVEHNFHITLEVATRCYVMNNGKIVYTGESSELLGDEALQKKLLAI